MYPDLGVIWIDAHADANTPSTSLSGHYHGMPAAHIMGWFGYTMSGFEWIPEDGCVNAANLAYIGLRDVDPGEAALLRQSNVHVYTMRDVDKHGIAKAASRVSALSPTQWPCNSRGVLPLRASEGPNVAKRAEDSRR